MYQLDLGTSVHLFHPDGPNKDFQKELKEIKKEGFKSVEVSIGKAGGYKVSLERCIQEVGDGLQAVLDEGLIVNSIHMPFARFSYISSHDDEVRLFVLDAFCQILEICDKYNPKHYVIHSRTRDKNAPYWDMRKAALIDSFSKMVAKTKNNICMENMVGSCPNNVADMVDILGEIEGVKCCIDMNHFLHDKPEDAIPALSKCMESQRVGHN